jgi:predicted MFS family arabinose efflux permease
MRFNVDRLRQKLGATFWSANLTLLASVVFLDQFGQGLLGGARTNFFIDTLGLSGGQVLWLEGIRELPGLALMFIAALMMRWSLSRRAAVSVFIMGAGYALYAFVGSYVGLLLVAIVASLGFHMWMPLNSALAMCLSERDKTGRVLGTLSSVGALAALAGMGVISLVARLFESMSLGTYYVAGGAFIVVAAFLLTRLPAHIGATETEQPRMLLKRHYWLYYVLTFFEGSRKQVLGTFGTLVLVDSFGLKVWQISLILLASSIVNLVSGPYVGHLVDRFGERSTVSASYVILVLCCLGFSTLHDVWILVVLLVVIKLMVMFGMGLSTYVYRSASPEELTPTLSAGISINHVTSVAMPLVAGALLPIIKYEGIFLGTGALVLLSVPFALALRTSQSPVSQVAPATAK